MQVAEKHQTDGNPSPGRFLVRWLAMPVLLLLIVTLFEWKLVLTNQFTWLEGADTANQVLPWLQFQVGEWHRLHFPLWEPSGFAGQPLFGQGQPGAAYPLNWLLFLFPTHGGWIRQDALHWYFVLIRYLAALAAYALCRDLGRSRPASVLGAAVYALGGYVGNTMWPQMVNGAVWTPLAFLFLLRAARGRHPWPSALLSGFFLGIGWLAGHHQMNLFVTLAAAGLWLWLILRNGFDGKLAKLAAAAMLMVAAASAFQTIPMAEYGARALRWTGSPQDPLGPAQTVAYTVHEQYSLPPSSLLGIFVPNVEWSWPPYIGIAAFALALLGAAMAWRSSPPVRWLSVIALAGILFALGPNSVLHGVLYAVFPLIDKARVPAAATLVFALGIAPLAAFGLDLVHRPENFPLTRRAGWWLTGIGAVFATAAFVFFTTRLEVVTDTRTVIPAIGALALAAVLAAWRGGSLTVRAGSVAIIGLALFEIANVTNYNLPSVTVPEQNPYLRPLAAYSEAVGYIASQGQAVRIDYDDQAIHYNLGDWYGLESIKGSGPSVTANLWRMDLFSPRGQDFFGVRYYIGTTPSRANQLEVFHGPDGFNVYQNPTALPRVWAVHQATTTTDPREAIADGEVDPLTTAFVVDGEPPTLAPCPGAAGDDVQMPLHAANYVQIRADLTCRGMVILTDTYYPGWRATVDGQSAEIHEVYGGVRGVIVEAGSHVIEMRYRPWSVLAGLLLTLAAAVVAAVSMWKSRAQAGPVRAAP